MKKIMMEIIHFLSFIKLKDIEIDKLFGNCFENIYYNNRNYQFLKYINNIIILLKFSNVN